MEKRPGHPLSALALVLGAALGCADARATVCNATVPAACVNTYTLFGQLPEITLTSDLRYTGPVVQLRYVVGLQALDALLTVRWAEVDGTTIVHAENTFGWFNSYVSWSRQWVGVLGPNPSVTLLTGSADFNGSFPRPSNCPGGVCDARYYDWTANVPGGSSGGSRGGGAGVGARTQPVAAPAAPTATPLPSGFENATQTISAVQSVIPSAGDPGDPGDLGQATFTDEYRFSSRVASEAGGWRYVYTFENLSDEPVDFALDELGFAGRAATAATVTMEVSSAFGPGVLAATPTVRRNAFSAASGRFDALVPLLPVPEPQSLVLLLAGLGGLGVAARRDRRRRPSAQALAVASAEETRTYSPSASIH